jgi:hypothetical protein
MQAPWTASDVGSRAGCSAATVTRAVQRGELRALPRNGNWQLRFDPVEARRWIRWRRERRP